MTPDSIHTWRDFHEQNERERWQREFEHRARGGDVEEEDGDRRGFYYERIPVGRAQHRADGGLEYQRPTFGGSLKGAFKLPHNAVRALGNGDADAGLAVSDQLFGHHIALGRGTVHPDVLHDIGNGDIKAGRRVLQKLVTMLRQKRREP